MRRLISSIGVRGLVAICLVLAVAAIVTIGRLVGSRQSPQEFSDPSTSVTPTHSDDAEGEALEVPSSPSTDQELVALSTQFAQLWINKTLAATTWRERISSMTTARLAESLSHVRPDAVPASRIVGAPIVTLNTVLYARVSIPMDTGTLSLSFYRKGSAWQIDEIDWDRI